MRGNGVKGYRLEAGHKDRVGRSAAEKGLHINVYDYSSLKRKAGGLNTVIPIKGGENLNENNYRSIGRGGGGSSFGGPGGGPGAGPVHDGNEIIFLEPGEELPDE